ncbi:Bromodomain containing protein, partial [Aphelenchoides avenae]
MDFTIDNHRLADGVDAHRELQDSYRHERSSADRRLVYMHVHAGMLPANPANCDLSCFGKAVFYVGKGTLQRPFHHLEQAKKALLNASDFATLTPCVARIASIWLNGRGIIVVPVITRVCDDEAKTREAALIALRSAGLLNLTNKAAGVFKGHEHWTAQRKVQLGLLELMRAFECYKQNRIRALKPQEIPLSAGDLEAWQALCPVPHLSNVVEEAGMLDGVHTASANAANANKADGDSDASETVPVTVGIPSDDAWDDYCFVCKEGCDDNTGDLGCCAGCSHVYHNGCHVPRITESMKNLPDDWKCSLCQQFVPLCVRTPGAFGRQAQA